MNSDFEDRGSGADRFREAIARAAAAAKQAPAGALLLIEAELPAVPVERLLATELPGERALLIPAADDSWAIAGIGAAARVSVESGATRFAMARDRSRALLASVIRPGSPDPESPSPRLVGGCSFVDEPARTTPWEEFGAVDFVLPRWSLFASGSTGFLRLAIAPRELRSSQRELEEELVAIETALATPVAARGPRAARLEPPAYEPWEALVRACLGAIAAGTLEKVVPARGLHALADAPFDPALAAGAGEPGSTRFLFERNGTFFAGRTPERLVQLAGDLVRCDALAGSIPVSADDSENAERIAALLSSDKERREHELVVRGLVEELSRFALLSPPPEGPVVRSLRTVHHLHTPLEGTVIGAPHLFDLAAALHPTAAVAGRPTRAALEFLAQHDGLDRGWYAAPVGWVDGNGEGELWVALRSAAIRETNAWAYAGAGVVADSTPEAEWKETEAKAASILGALGVVP